MGSPPAVVRWLCVSMTPRAKPAGVLNSWQGHPGQRIEAGQKVIPWSSRLGVGRKVSNLTPQKLDVLQKPKSALEIMRIRLEQGVPQGQQ